MVGRLEVDQAGKTCGAAGEACWKPIGAKGWAYRDPSSSADGVKRLLTKSGDAGKGSVRLKARNRARKGLTSLPVGLAAALEASAHATAQLIADDAGCVSARLERVREADGTVFEAKTSP